MIFDRTGIIYSSLMGANVTESIPRFQAVQNELSKHVLPPIPFLPAQSKTTIAKSSSNINAELWKADAPTAKADQFFPFSFVGADGVEYLLPYEPIINISGKNNIIKRNVAKAKTKGGEIIGGSIKERWTQNDYEISITGVLIGSIMTGNHEACYPRADFIKLRDFMIAPKSLRVYCEPLQLLGIHYIVIEDFTFPFTKGENVQAYTIKAYSDFEYKLLIGLND